VLVNRAVLTAPTSSTCQSNPPAEPVSRAPLAC